MEEDGKAYLSRIDNQVKVHSTCEMGAYFTVGGGVAFIPWNEIVLKSICDGIDQKFESEWPEKWIAIKSTIPGDFGFVDDGHGRDRLVSDISDFFRLTMFDLLVSGIGEKTAERVLRGIAKSKSQTWAKCLFALGIEGVGQRTAKQLSEYYKDIDELGREPFNELVKHSGIGGTVAESLVQYFHKESSWWTIESLRRGGVDGLFGWRPVPKKLPKMKNEVAGKEFMFTGRLSITRTKAQMKVIDAGGYIGSSVNKSTDYLVVGEDPGEKQFKAQVLGIKMITEEEFNRMVENG